MSLSCYNSCRVLHVKNTGFTEDNLIFVDCSGNTNTVFVQPNTETVLNFCLDEQISGNTSGNIITLSISKVDTAFYFSSCCEDTQFFTFMGSNSQLSIDDVIYGNDFILSNSGLSQTFQCSRIYSKNFSQTPPIVGDLVCAINEYQIYQDLGCQQCLDENPCIRQCYSLMACDGLIEPITSDDPSLSAYVNTFVYIDITGPVPSTPTTPFLVSDIGVVGCKNDVSFTILSASTECDCRCFIFKTPEEVFETTFVDCDYNFLKLYLPTGQTFSVCSYVRPYFDTEKIIPVKLGGLCIDGECPPQSVATIRQRNECDVLTIFPMEVFCMVENPTRPKAYDGEATLIITGGTPPYTIYWDIGSIGQTITNLDFGQYSATVTDFYNDFSARTTCVLTGQTPTTTTTTTTTPIPSYENLCVNMTVRAPKGYEIQQFQLEPDVDVNGYPSWSSSGSQYTLYWNTGNTNNWVFTGNTFVGVSFINNNPAIPPLTGWQILGSAQYKNMTILTGNCSPSSIIDFETSVTPAQCGNDGSMIINVIGGIPPYLYSINNGLTYQQSPIFQNIGPSNYQVYVKDSLGTLILKLVNVPSLPAPAVTVQLSANTSSQTFVVSSNLPSGFTLTFDINHVSDFGYYPASTSPLPVYNNLVTVSGFGPLTQNVNQQFQTVIIPYCSITPTQKNNQHKEYGNTFTLTTNQTITGSYTNTIINPPNDDCSGDNNSFTIFISNAIINECECCPVTVINPSFGPPTPKL